MSLGCLLGFSALFPGFSEVFVLYMLRERCGCVRVYEGGGFVDVFWVFDVVWGDFLCACVYYLRCT